MRRKDKKIQKEAEKKTPVITSAPTPVITSAPRIKETTIFKEAIALQKEGWVIIEIKSAQMGIRDKTWVLKK